MKKYFTTIIFCLCLILKSTAQVNLNSAWKEEHFDVSPIYILSVKGHPDIYLDGVFTAYLSTISQRSIQSMEVWKDSKSLETFGNRGKNGVIHITLYDGSVLLLTKDLLKKYHVKQRNRHLPIYVNKIQIPNPNKIYFDLAGIKSVNVENYEDTKQPIINIITDSTN